MSTERTGHSPMFRDAASMSVVFFNSLSCRVVRFPYGQFAFQPCRFIFSNFGMKRLLVGVILLFASAELFAQQNAPPLQQQDATPPVAPQQNTPPLPPPPEEGAPPLKPAATPPPVAPIVVA